MAECCIDGCSNKATKRGELKFYTLPTAKSSRPNKVRRRRLWLEAIEKANRSSVAGLKEDAQICSAHFVSGQMSLEVSDQDFVPSVFPPHRENTRRETLRPRSGVLVEAPKETPKKKAERKRAKTHEEVAQVNNEFPEVNYCEPLEDEELFEEEVTTQLPTYPVTKEPSNEAPPEYPELKKPKLQLKSIVACSGLFRCEVCNGKFSSGSLLVKHKKLHDQEWSDEESWPTVSEKVSEKSDFNDFPIPVEEPSFKCNMCDRSFPTNHNLKRHKLLHVRDARKCKQCGTMFCKRHNHVVAQPQISTETNFKDYTKEDNTDLCTENQMPDTSSHDDDIVDESSDLLLNSDSQTLDALAAAQDQSVQDTEQKLAPTITFNPRKPGLLTAFKSFLTKHKVSNINTEPLENSSSSSSSTQIVVSPQVITTTAIPHTTVTAAARTSATINAPTPATAITTANASQPVRKTCRKPLPLVTCTNTSTPQAGKPVLFISKPPQPGQPLQNTEQSTVCLSFNKPVPSNVLKEFMSFISKNECGKSSGPRLVTYTSKPEEAKPKQDLPSNEYEISSNIKLEPSAVPIDGPQTPNKPTVPQSEEKTTFIITTQKIFPAPLKAPLFVTPQKAPLSSSSIVSPVQFKFQSKDMQTGKTKPFPIELDAPLKHYVHESRPPSPEPIIAKMQRGPWDSPFPNYPKHFIQPHLPQTPALPPSLQMFSPQFLTSTFLDVKRDYDYILSK